MLALHEKNNGHKHTIKRDWEKAHARGHSKQLIYHFVFRSNPTGEVEGAQIRKDEIREPVPAERDGVCNCEKCIPRHSPSVETNSILA
jgi:hypothetical protein